MPNDKLHVIHPLVVVGAGPVGLTAALAARHHQLPVLIVEAEPEDRTRPGSRATYLFQETLDLLESVADGVTAPITEQANNWESLRTTYSGRQVYFKRFPPCRPGKFGAAISQRESEQVLLKRCHEEGVQFRWKTSVTGVHTTSDRVTLTLDDGSRLHASYVIAADGARSAVRRALGIELDGDRSESSFVIVDVAEDPAAPLERTRSFHYRSPAVDGRNVLMVPFAGGWRIDLECRPDEDVRPWQEEPLLSQWVAAVAGPKYASRISWVSTYRFHRSVALSYTDDHARVLLTGEAAHLFPPFGGGRGLNSGVPDAIFGVEAIAKALSDPASARQIINAVATERRLAGIANRDAASSALVHMEARGRLLRLQQRLAALLARWFRRPGEWLDRAPMGPSRPVSARSRF
jgi:3-(3-hydroxy-phenyl)propionate hydroxylase